MSEQPKKLRLGDTQKPGPELQNPRMDKGMLLANFVMLKDHIIPSIIELMGRNLPQNSADLQKITDKFIEIRDRVREIEDIVEK